MGQHNHSRGVGLDSLDGFVLLHISDSVDHRIDLSHECPTMLQGTFTSSQLCLPAGIEERGARQDHVRVMFSQDAGQTTQVDESGVDEGGVERDSARQERDHFSQADGMIPYMQCALPLDFTDDTIRSACEMMRCLENIGNLFGDGNREDKQIYEP